MGLGHSKEARGRVIVKDHPPKSGISRKKREAQYERRRELSHNGNGERPRPLQELTQFTTAQLKGIKTAVVQGKRGEQESKTNYRARLAKEQGMTPERFLLGVSTLAHLQTNQTSLDSIAGVRLMVADRQTPGEISYDLKPKPSPQSQQQSSNGTTQRVA